MRIVDCKQRSEQWEEVRRGIPTASKFCEIVTPAKGEKATSVKWTKYAAHLISESFLGKDFIKPPPTFDMQYGIDNEENALGRYCWEHDKQLKEVGFIFPDDHAKYGCSPDSMILDGQTVTNSGVEIKCPKVSTLVEWIVTCKGKLPAQHKPQVQGSMMITGAETWDFFAWRHEHEDLTYFVRVERDEKYINRMREVIDEFLDFLDGLREAFGVKPRTEV